MSDGAIVFPGGKGAKRRDSLKAFANAILRIRPAFNMTIRGWCYFLEGQNAITKSGFEKTAKAINECRYAGYLPVDLIVEENGRGFSNVVEITKGGAAYVPDERLVLENIRDTILGAMAVPDSQYELGAYMGQDYYIQLLVEKIDLKTLFEPVCSKYNVPIANAKGWSSLSLRADLTRRFKTAESQGLKCVLLYFGDHDPDGLNISKCMLDNIDKSKNFVWEDGCTGYDPEKLVFERVGLNYDFIEANRLVWIDNLETSSGKDLSDPEHGNNKKEYVRDYINKYGARKCEANALLRVPDTARELCEDAIIKYLGEDYEERRREITRENKTYYDAIVKQTYDNAVRRVQVNGLTLNQYLDCALNRVNKVIQDQDQEDQDQEDQDQEDQDLDLDSGRGAGL